MDVDLFPNANIVEKRLKSNLFRQYYVNRLDIPLTYKYSTVFFMYISFYVFIFHKKYLDVNNTVAKINMLIYSFIWSLLNYFNIIMYYFNIIMLVVSASRISQRGAPTFKGSTKPKGGINLLFRPNFQKTTWKWRKLGGETGRHPIFQHSRQNPVTLLVRTWNFYISPFFSFSRKQMSRWISLQSKIARTSLAPPPPHAYSTSEQGVIHL